MGSKSQASSQSQSSATQALDPQIKGSLLGNYGNVQNLVANTPSQYGGQLVAGFDPAQTQAQNSLISLANSGLGNSELDQATGTASGVANYSPSTYSGQTYDPSTGSASLIDRSAIGNVGVDPVSSDAISHYLNPYTSSVIDTTNQQLGLANDQAQTANNQAATSAGAFGGDRAGVQAALTNEAYLRTLGSTDAGLNNANYAQALGAAQNDQALGLQAATTNQGVNASVAQQNAAAQNNFGLANLSALNTAGQFNAGQRQSALAGNQQAGLAGAGLNLNAAASLAALSGQKVSQATGLASLLSQAGGQRQALAQNVLDQSRAQFQTNLGNKVTLQQLINQALGLAGNPVLGSSQSSGSGSSSTTSISNPFALIPFPGT